MQKIYTYNKIEIDDPTLLFFPIPTNVNGDDDMYIYPHPIHGAPTIEITDNEINILKSIVDSFNGFPYNVMEIGIDRNGERSFTRTFLTNKHPDTKYLGIDLDDKSYLNDSSKNIFTLKTNSHSQTEIRFFLKDKNMLPLDILFIDGWHSINTCFNDWKYSNLLKVGGYVICHDVNTHPGPSILMEAINPEYFEVTLPCTNIIGTFGIGICKKIK